MKMEIRNWDKEKEIFGFLIFTNFPSTHTSSIFCKLIFHSKRWEGSARTNKKMKESKGIGKDEIRLRIDRELQEHLLIFWD